MDRGARQAIVDRAAKSWTRLKQRIMSIYTHRLECKAIATVPS